MSLPRILLCFGLLFSLLSSGQTTFGQTRDWGGLTGNWSIASNWVQNDVPNSVAETAVLGGAGTYDVTYDLITTIGDLQISNQNASLTFAPTVSSLGLTVNSDFTTNGTINLDSNVDGRDATLLRAGNIINSATGEINFGGTSTAASTDRSLQADSFVNNGAVNVNQNGKFNRTNGVYTNNNNFNVASGAALSFGNSNTFNQEGGTFDNQGEFVFSSDTLNFNGGNFTGNAVDLLSSTLNIGASSTGTGTFDMTGVSGSYSGDLAVAQTLNINALLGSNSSTTATANFTNNGSLNLNSNFDGRDVTLLRTGNFTNSATGVINFGGTSTSASTGRNLQADSFENNGTVNVNQNGLFNRTSGVYTNNNNVNVASGATLGFGNTNTFNQDGGTFDNQGSLMFVNDTLNYNGGNFTGNAVDLLSSTLNIGGSSTGTGTFDMTGVSGSYSGNLAVAQTLNLNALSSSATSTTATADFTNNGTLNLNSNFDGRDVTLLRTGNIINSATGVINFGGTSTSPSTGRNLQADSFENNGTVNVNQNGLFNRTSGVYTNNNNFNVASGATLGFGNTNTFNQDGGTFDNQGSLMFVNDTLNYNGGNFTGNAVDLLSSTFNIGGSSTGTGTFDMTGISGSYSGDLAVAQTLNLNALSGSATSTTATADFSNNGTLNLNSNFDGRDVALLRTGNITNSATGVINFGGTSTSASTDRNLQADLFENDGTVNVNRNGSFTRTSGVYTNNNNVNVASGATLSFGNSNTFNQDGGTFDNQGAFVFSSDTLNFNGGNFIGNAVDLLSSTLNIGVSSTGTGTFDMTGVSGSYSGNLALAQTLNLNALSSSATSTTATADFANNGTINLNSDFDGRDVTFTRAGTITNSATGVINFGGISTGGTTDRHLNAELNNAGLIDVIADGTGTRIGATGDNHLNSGTMISRNATNIVTILGSTFTNEAGGTLAGLGEYDFTQTSLANNGIVDPGSSAGTLHLDGSVVFGSTAKLKIELGGVTPGLQYDVLNLLDNVTLDGSLSVSFINGFEALVTDSNSFTVLTSNSLSGTFFDLADGASLITSDGLGTFTVNYVGNNVVLGNFIPVPEPGVNCLFVFAVIGLMRRRVSSRVT